MGKKKQKVRWTTVENGFFAGGGEEDGSGVVGDVIMAANGTVGYDDTSAVMIITSENGGGDSQEDESADNTAATSPAPSNSTQNGSAYNGYNGNGGQHHHSSYNNHKSQYFNNHYNNHYNGHGYHGGGGPPPRRYWTHNNAPVAPRFERKAQQEALNAALQNGDAAYAEDLPNGFTKIRSKNLDVLFKRDYYAQYAQRLNTSYSTGSSIQGDEDREDCTLDGVENGDDAAITQEAINEVEEEEEGVAPEAAGEQNGENTEEKVASDEIIEGENNTEDKTDEGDISENAPETEEKPAQPTVSSSTSQINTNATPFYPSGYQFPSSSTSATTPYSGGNVAACGNRSGRPNLYLYSPSSNTMIPCEEIIIPNPVMSPEGPVYQGPSNIYLAFPSDFSPNGPGHYIPQPQYPGSAGANGGPQANVPVTSVANGPPPPTQPPHMIQYDQYGVPYQSYHHHPGGPIPHHPPPPPPVPTGAGTHPTFISREHSMYQSATSSEAGTDGPSSAESTTPHSPPDLSVYSPANWVADQSANNSSSSTHTCQSEPSPMVSPPYPTNPYVNQQHGAYYNNHIPSSVPNGWHQHGTNGRHASSNHNHNHHQHHHYHNRHYNRHNHHSHHHHHQNHHLESSTVPTSADDRSEEDEKVITIKEAVSSSKPISAAAKQQTDPEQSGKRPLPHIPGLPPDQMVKKQQKKKRKKKPQPSSTSSLSSSQSQVMVQSEEHRGSSSSDDLVAEKQSASAALHHTKIFESIDSDHPVSNLSPNDSVTITREQSFESNIDEIAISTTSSSSHVSPIHNNSSLLEAETDEQITITVSPPVELIERQEEAETIIELNEEQIVINKEVQEEEREKENKIVQSQEMITTIPTENNSTNITTPMMSDEACVPEKETASAPIVDNSVEENTIEASDDASNDIIQSETTNPDENENNVATYQAVNNTMNNDNYDKVCDVPTVTENVKDTSSVPDADAKDLPKNCDDKSDAAADNSAAEIAAVSDSDLIGANAAANNFSAADTDPIVTIDNDSEIKIDDSETVTIAQDEASSIKVSSTSNSTECIKNTPIASAAVQGVSNGNNFQNNKRNRNKKDRFNSKNANSSTQNNSNNRKHQSKSQPSNSDDKSNNSSFENTHSDNNSSTGAPKKLYSAVCKSIDQQQPLTNGYTSPQSSDSQNSSPKREIPSIKNSLNSNVFSNGNHYKSDSEGLPTNGHDEGQWEQLPKELQEGEWETNTGKKSRRNRYKKGAGNEQQQQQQHSMKRSISSSVTEVNQDDSRKVETTTTPIEVSVEREKSISSSSICNNEKEISSPSSQEHNEEMLKTESDSYQNLISSSVKSMLVNENKGSSSINTIKIRHKSEDLNASVSQKNKKEFNQIAADASSVANVNSNNDESEISSGSKKSAALANKKRKKRSSLDTSDKPSVTTRPVLIQDGAIEIASLGGGFRRIKRASEVLDGCHIDQAVRQGHLDTLFISEIGVGMGTGPFCIGRLKQGKYSPPDRTHEISPFIEESKKKLEDEEAAAKDDNDDEEDETTQEAQITEITEEDATQEMEDKLNTDIALD